MGYEVDRVVICDAFEEPDAYYDLLAGGKSRRTKGRRPSMRFLASGKAAKSGIRGLVGDQPALFEQMTPGEKEFNDYVNQLREEVRGWRESGWAGTANVTRELLTHWFDRNEERAKQGKRFFFCQQEAVETVIYLYEVMGKRRMPETGNLIRYALKLATGTGKTVVMALLITWSTLHRQKVSGSSLSRNFLVLVPNVTVRDRVSGEPRGDGLIPGSEHCLYEFFDMVPPAYKSEFHPNVQIRNWQGIPLESRRDDWLPKDVVEKGRFVPAAVLRAMQKRTERDPSEAMRSVLGGWRDVVIINDEAHHVYGEKRSRQGEEPDYIRWSKILEHISKAAKVSLVVDLSATPWYGSGSPKPEGSLFEWLVSDFSVYDAFESGLVKVVRLPEPDKQGKIYIDLWELVKDAKTGHEYIQACRGAIAGIYSSWKDDYQQWSALLDFERKRTPSPVLLCVADNAKRAAWLFNHLTSGEFSLLKNRDPEDRASWVTVQIDSGVFNADKGNEALIREMISTVGSRGAKGEHVRCIVSVSMLSEGWDVKSVSHIIGLRAFGSPLLTEQIIGRGLRRVSYDLLYQPLKERPADSDETVDAFGIPFVGFPVQKKKRAKTGTWNGTVVHIEPDNKKKQFRLEVPNVRAWAVGVTRALRELIRIKDLPGVMVTSNETPPEISVKPVVGGKPEAVLTLEHFLQEWPINRTAFKLAEELMEATNPSDGSDLHIGPTFEELLEVTREYLETRVQAQTPCLPDFVGMYYWRTRARDVLENAIRSTKESGVRPVPIPGTPEVLDTGLVRKFQWSGITADGHKCHLTRVPCHVELEKQFADFLDSAPDVLRYFKNERFGFSVTYFENGRPRQYYPDFIVEVKDRNRSLMWLAETKGEIRSNTALKSQAARAWCERMSQTHHGPWYYLFAQQVRFEKAMKSGVKTYAELAAALSDAQKAPHLRLVGVDDPRVADERFRSLLPVYSLKAAAGYFGSAQDVTMEGWVDASEVGRLEEGMFVAQAKGRSMEPEIRDGDWLVFRRPQGHGRGKVILAQYRGPADPETGGAYTVKRYRNERKADPTTGERRDRIILTPTNPDFKPIEFVREREDDFVVVGEYVGTLGVG